LVGHFPLKKVFHGLTFSTKKFSVVGHFPLEKSFPWLDIFRWKKSFIWSHSFHWKKGLHGRTFSTGKKFSMVTSLGAGFSLLAKKSAFWKTVHKYATFVFCGSLKSKFALSLCFQRNTHLF
jgi:hypothetical protein